MTKPVIARIEQAGFVGQESFKTKTDADHWQQMVTETLNHPEKIDFDLQTYAAGLADSVRTYGGPVTLDAWLNLQVSPEAWQRAGPSRSTSRDS